MHQPNDWQQTSAKEPGSQEELVKSSYNQLCSTVAFSVHVLQLWTKPSINNLCVVRTSCWLWYALIIIQLCCSVAWILQERTCKTLGLRYQNQNTSNLRVTSQMLTIFWSLKVTAKPKMETWPTMPWALLMMSLLNSWAAIGRHLVANNHVCSPIGTGQRLKKHSVWNGFFTLGIIFPWHYLRQTWDPMLGNTNVRKRWGPLPRFQWTQTLWNSRIYH